MITDNNDSCENITMFDSTHMEYTSYGTDFYISFPH